MTTTDDLDERMARLREEWPVGSMVDNVMARIKPNTPRRNRLRGRLFAGLAASGLIAAFGLAWVFVLSQPKTLLASVQDDLKRAQTAHLVMTVWNERDSAQKAEIWYRRNGGLRAESPEQVIVEDGKTQWSWRTDAKEGARVVLRQSSPGFFSSQLRGMLALPDVPGDWTRVRTPDLDREINGKACQGFTFSPKDGKQASDRGLVLADADGRIYEITVQHRKGETWGKVREIQIEYDVPVPAEQIAMRLPDGAQVIDREEAFHGRYPLDRALQKVEMGGLILAVHDLQPLKDREGFYVVSSVRGSAEFLKQYPPKRRELNPEYVALDVAFQPGSNMIQGSKYDRIVMGSAARDGVEYSWWLIVPRRFYQVKDGKRVYMPENNLSAMPGEPGQLDVVAGKGQIPLSATYWDEKHRDANGVQQGVSTWAEVPLPPAHPPTTIEDVAGHARQDLLLMGVGGAGGLLGVAADLKPAPQTLRPLSRFTPETVSDADFAAAVRRGLEDLRQFDETRELRPEDMILPGAVGGPGR